VRIKKLTINFMGNTNKITVPSILIALGIILMGMMIVLSFMGQVQKADASTPRYAEYQSTTTSTTNTAVESLILTGPNTLGSVVITTAAAGTINIYDATTSNVLLRTGNVASSTILKASFANSAAVGTYTFDTLNTTGLLLEVTGTIPTSTITYRPN